MKLFRKMICCILCAAVLAVGLSWRAYAEEQSAGESALSAPKAAVLMEAETGQVLYSVNAQARLPMGCAS